MTAFQMIVTAGLTLGVVQLLAGVAIGWWLCRRRSKPSTPGDSERAARLAADLRSLTDAVASSVRRHNAAIESIDQRLRSEVDQASTAGADAPLTNLVVGVVRQMLSANQQLQSNLHETEEELKRTADQLASHRQEARTDPLTGLPNRRALDERVERLMDEWRSDGTRFSLLLLDIDHFKRFNDTHGHPAGDAALQAFAKCVAAALRRHDFIARFGGEEFAVLLPHTTLDEAAGAVRKARQAMAAIAVPVGGRQLKLTASGGVACVRAGEAGGTLLSRADEALYAAKGAGRDCVFLHDGERVLPMLPAEPGGTGLPDGLPDDLQAACQDLRAGMEAFLSRDTTPAQAGAPE